MDEEVTNDQHPMYFNFLSLEDQKSYDKLRNVLAAPDHRYNRNKRIDTFTDMLEQIKAFCIRNDAEDWKRYLVCGICWINNDIAINTRQLRVLLGKSKSTINGAFSKMGYETLPYRNNDNGLLDLIPFLRGNFNESRQWTVRRLNSIGISDCPHTEVTASPELCNCRTQSQAQSSCGEQFFPDLSITEVLPEPPEEFTMSFGSDNENEEVLFSEFDHDESHQNDFEYILSQDDDSLLFFKSR